MANSAFSAPTGVNTLANGDIFVGNASNVATAVAMSGDVTISNTGATTVAKIAGTTVSSTTGTTNVVFSASPTITGTMAVAAQTNSGLLYLNGGVAESALYSNGNSGTSLTIALDHGNTQSVTITGAVTIAVTVPTHPGKFTIIITQDGSGHVYSFTGIKWPSGTQPTWSSSASAIDIASFIYDGTNIYGMGQTAFS